MSEHESKLRERVRRLNDAANFDPTPPPPTDPPYVPTPPAPLVVPPTWKDR